MKFLSFAFKGLNSDKQITSTVGGQLGILFQVHLRPR